MTNDKWARIYTGADYRTHATIARAGGTDKAGGTDNVPLPMC